MAYTTNYNLFVTDDPSTTFKTWREAMNATSDSNMTKIDAALNTINTATSGKQATITANGILKGNGSGTITEATVDSSPTNNSSNLVTSGGVYTALSGKAASSHNHAASNITSGTLSVSRGGTGKSSVTSGNYLVGNGTSALSEKTPSQVRTDIGAVQVVEYSTNVIFDKDDWVTDSNGYYSQTISVTGLLASYSASPHVACVLTGTNKDDDYATLQGFSKINIFDTGTNTLTAKCIKAAPTVDVPVKVAVYA